MSNLNDVYIYRMTHIQNIPHILEQGITHRNSPKANQHYKPIGDGSLIKTRDNKLLWVNNGEDFSFDHQQIKLGDFTPFYFGKRMPMLFVIQKGYNAVQKQMPQDIIYLVCSINSIIGEGVNFYFTDGHATDNLTSCYERSESVRIKDIVDFEAVKTKDWTTERDLKRRKEAECLISGNIPVNCIAGFICFNDVAAEQLRNMGVDNALIHVRPNYYF